MIRSVPIRKTRSADLVSISQVSDLESVIFSTTRIHYHFSGLVVEICATCFSVTINEHGVQNRVLLMSRQELLPMSRKDLAQRFRHMIELEGYSFKEDYELIQELWQDYVNFMLELGNITPSKHATVFDHY